VSIFIGYNGRTENERVISEYIKKQLEEDYTHEQISISEYIDPFTGIKNK
jgi:tranposase-like protein